MKNLVIILILLLPIPSNSIKPLKNDNMNISTIKTSIGEIVYYRKEVKGTNPVIFLHGVYYDHNLWNYQTSRITDRTVITIDMPLHGKSKKISKTNWTMNDCSNMLIEILDNLKIDKCYAIGHSWGSMTILRAASEHPKRFLAIGLCNMPTKKGSFGTKVKFNFQHSMLGFRSFYTKQVANAMFSSENQIQKPEMVEYLDISMSQLSNRDIRQTDKAVIANVDSGMPFLEKLNVNALALKGEDDYVMSLPNIKTTIVKGKHTSPLEQPEEVYHMIKQLFTL